ncbi:MULTISPECIES: protein-tyrosine phosphatase family protein [Leucobacter]|uniref:protein-tyrosine phosphatase family protein n=1 Tax=Microbacteriaceae TaxID=85023 RepID=UPI00313301C8
MGRWEPGGGIVELPDGRRVRGRGLRAARHDTLDPEFGVYLTGRAPRVGDWPHQWVRWRDFRRPDGTPETVAALREAYERAATERVEIACGGGIGRTGTALAVLAVMSGVPASDAVAWVRAHYHPHAVETRGQRRWVSEVAAALID